MSVYHEDKEVKRKIDEVLHKNVQLFQNLGVSSTKQERYEAGVKERNSLRAIKELDPEMINFLLLEK